jgi:hypothetical protein
MPFITVNKVVEKNRIIVKNGGQGGGGEEQGVADSNKIPEIYFFKYLVSKTAFRWSQLRGAYVFFLYGTRNGYAFEIGPLPTVQSLLFFFRGRRIVCY